ncbi:sugar phosphate isomerase/epimerase family protein [Stratiformator vulcanicus]|uniref:Xylose isomerase-like TIM barrel n=1 Tax=Stratiformator vulcanicus TaxID=2527980 RepID=A0A517R401_9PLAN|nr:TIM barrel protein [Stratiformator vulcanicus]QDT38570.1 Xylose isomerase-like TIM barrel [Stratiformator vulcanicus]
MPETLLKAAVPTRLFETGIKQAIENAATFGVTGVQVDVRSELTADEFGESARRQLTNLLGDFGLKIAAAEFPLKRKFMDEYGLDERIAVLTAAIEFAAVMKAPVLSFPIWGLPTADHDEDQNEYRLAVELLADLARLGDHFGVLLAPMPVGNEALRLGRILAEVDTGPTGVYLDPAAVAVSGDKLRTVVSELHDRIAQVRIRDAVRDMDGRVLEVPVGRGEVDWSETIAVLQEASFDGWYIADRSEGSEKLGDVSRALSFLHNVAFGS